LTTHPLLVPRSKKDSNYTSTPLGSSGQTFFHLSLWNENISTLTSRKSWVDTGRLNSKTKTNQPTDLIYSFNKYLYQAGNTKKLYVCVMERHLILDTKLSKYNLYYLWSVFCLSVTFTKLTIITVMWGLKCTDSD
jgi:hypothetical protein